MTRSNHYRRPFYALLIIASFTLDTISGLTRVELPIYHAANGTYQAQPQKQWQPGQTIVGSTNSPNLGWGASPNQWNHNSPTSGHQGVNYNGYNGYIQNSSLVNPWQRYNNQTLSHPSTNTYNPGLPGWNTHQQNPYLPNATTTTNNWQYRTNQSHLYPQLPQVSGGGGGVGRPLQPLVPPPTTPSTNSWNSNDGRWKSSFVPQQYPGGAVVSGGNLPNQHNWSSNRTFGGSNVPANVVPGYSPSSSKGIPVYQGAGGYQQNQTNGINYNNYNNNNPGLGGIPNPAQNLGSNNNGQPIGWTGTGGNGAASNWPNASRNNGLDTNNYNNNNNWSNSGRGTGGNSGPALAPIGGSAGGVPLAPIGGVGGGSASVPGSWNTVSNNGNNGLPQLAPLAPLSYGTNNPYEQSKKTNPSNPYAVMFN